MKTRRPEEHGSNGALSRPVVVLDVDKKSASQRARNRFFAAAGFCVYQAAEANQAMEAAQTHLPDLVILSLDVPDRAVPDLAVPGSAAPDRDAVEICRRLKTASGKPPAMVLLIPSAEHRIDPLRCGADLCLPATLSPAFLIEALNPLLRMRKAEQELARLRKELLDFSTQIVHDIEGPLRGVVTFAELIGQAHPLSDHERTYLGHVLSSADQVRRLARCVLTYVLAKRDPPRLGVVPLRGVVSAALHVLRERIQEAAAGIQVEDPLPTALGDFSALQQVIHCLVSNAIDYRCRNGSLSIKIGVKPSPPGECLMFVSDNGIGVGKEYHESIFAPFKRLHGAEIPGAGMGLAISKHIVEAHGGRIWVESEAGSGASFLFTLRAPPELSPTYRS